MLPRKPLSFTTNHCFLIFKSAPIFFSINAKYRFSPLGYHPNIFFFYINGQKSICKYLKLKRSTSRRQLITSDIAATSATDM